MNVIKDAVHGNVRLSDFELKLIDTQPMQRLRRLKQVGMADLIYPGANHTRFEHSIGTMHLAGEIAESAGVRGHEEKLLRAAAVLHDVGHGAFSHESERILMRHTGKGHEEIGWERIKKGEIAEALHEEGISLNELKPIFFGKGVGQLISFDLGADRMDYLLRDSHYTGVAYGVIDYGRLIHTIRMSNGKAVVEHGGLEAAESMLIARFLMFSSVYYHHAVRIASAMLRKACEIAISERSLNASKIADMDDEGLMLALSSSRKAGKLAKMLKERRLFKRAVELSAYEMGESLKQKVCDDRFVEGLEKEIAQDARVEESSLVIDFPPDYNMEEAKVRVSKRDGSERPLREISDIVRAIESSEQGRRKLIVACAPEKKDAVAKSAKKLLASLT